MGTFSFPLFFLIAKGKKHPYSTANVLIAKEKDWHWGAP